ncbi:MAG: hypothetical protein V4722_01765 [Bacteroidota bacterium]
MGDFVGKSFAFSANPSLEYFSTKSTDKRQVTRGGSFNPGFGYQKEKGNTRYVPKQSSDAFIGGNAAVNIKAFTGLRFIETGYVVGARTGWGKVNYADTFLHKSNNKEASLELTFGIGTGRLENLTDAQMAFHILNDLQNQKLLTKDFSPAEMAGLAKTITNINNTRLFDYRRKRRFELQQIDSFLQKSGLVDAYSINYFTTLTDNWLYAFNPYRVQGKQKYIQLKPRISYWNEKSEVTNNNVFISEKSIYYTIIAELIAGIDDKKAVSITRQFNKGFSVATFYDYLRTKNYSNGADNTFINDGWTSSISGYLEWGYFPNTRTNVFANIKTRFSYDYSDQVAYNVTNLGFDANYFIGYNTRLIVSEGLSLNTPIGNGSGYKTYLNNRFSIGIEHFFR